MGYNEILTTGSWNIPKVEHIGYLDQHYSTITPELTTFEHISKLQANWTNEEIRHHLHDFLFRKNEEVNQISNNLSGGEKTRLCLGMIAAKTPKLLILDEITNNLDLETKTHVIQVLKEYPAAIIIVSHDTHFLNQINIDQYYEIKNKKLMKL